MKLPAIALASTVNPVTETDSAVNAKPGRRRLLGAAVVGTALAAIGAPAIVRAQSSPKIRIGYWPVSAGLPFYAAIEKGYFKEAGLDVEALKFAGAQPIMESMLAGRADGSANGTASAVMAIGDIAQQGLFKIFCSNPTNNKFILDEFVLPKESPVKVLADLKGKRIACGPGIQNLTLAKVMLGRAGATGFTVIELPIGQHIAAMAAGQIDGAYTLEPTGTIGRLNGLTRTLEVGVVSKYILGDVTAPWHGGAATLTTEFIKNNPVVAKKYIAAYARGVELVRSNPDAARPFLKGYTAIEGPLTSAVPMSGFMLYNEFKPADIAYFQKFFDLFSERGIFARRVLVDSLLYKG